MEVKKVALACDHAGFELKELLKNHLEALGFECGDFGCYSTESSDYPDFAHPMAEAVENEHYQMGISVCGTGNGINMTANKHSKIRAALCWNTEIALLARQHNDANVCSLPARFITTEMALQIIDTFINTSFEGGRHQRRIEKIPL